MQHRGEPIIPCIKDVLVGYSVRRLRLSSQAQSGSSELSVIYARAINDNIVVCRVKRSRHIVKTERPCDLQWVSAAESATCQRQRQIVRSRRICWVKISTTHTEHIRQRLVQCRIRVTSVSPSSPVYVFRILGAAPNICLTKRDRGMNRTQPEF